MDSQLVGGRVLRNRRSLAAKKDENKENQEIPVRVAKTPAKTPRRKKQSASVSDLGKAPPVTFATLNEDEDLSAAKQEILELQEELNLVRKDKNQLEDQLKDALDMPPPTPTNNDDEIEELRKKLIEMEEKQQAALKEAAEKDALFQKERQKLMDEKEKWQGHFDEFRQTETEKLQKLEAEQEEAMEKEKAHQKALQEKEDELRRVKEENQGLKTDKDEIATEKDTYSEAIESSLESLRLKLSTVEIARKEATKLADDQKQLARDVMDTYDGKLVDVSQKYENMKSEAQKNLEKAQRYRQERDTLREKLERYKKHKEDDKEKRRPKSPPRDPRARGGSDDSDIRKRKDMNGRSSKSVDIDPSELTLTSQYVFQEPFKKVTTDVRRIVLKPGEAPPKEAVKTKNACMPIRVALEPANFQQ